MTIKYLAWCAGFFDGEGCIMIQRRKRSETFIEHFVVVVVGQKRIEPLWELKRNFGGVLSGINTSGCYQWRSHGGTAETFLRSIRPFLVLKGEEVDCALEIRKTTGKPGNRLKDGIWKTREEIWKRFRIIRDKNNLPNPR